MTLVSGDLDVKNNNLRLYSLAKLLRKQLRCHFEHIINDNIKLN